jgi:acetyl-CoA C-acetyltransferase
LGAHALREALRRGRTDSASIQQVILGCAFPGGGNPARTAALAAGIPSAVPAFTPCMGEGSGLKAILLAAQGMRGSDLILAGGTESLSRVPYLVPGARWGVRIGEAELLDGLLLDAPTVHEEAQALASAHGISQAAQEAWSKESRRRALASTESRAAEIAPLEIILRRQTRLFSMDEPPEASPIPLQPGLAHPADGAAAVLLTSDSSRPSLGSIVGWAETGAGWAEAIRQLLRSTGLRFDEVDRWELHEPSAAHILALLAELPELDPERVNRRGGALALGNAASAGGTGLLLSLLKSLQEEGLHIGVVALPTAHGLGLAMAITRS